MALITQEQFERRPGLLMLTGIILTILSIGVFMFYVMFAFGGVTFLESLPEWAARAFYNVATLLFYASWIGAPGGVILFIVGLIKLFMEKFKKVQ